MEEDEMPTQGCNIQRNHNSNGNRGPNRTDEHEEGDEEVKRGNGGGGGSTGGGGGGGVGGGEGGGRGRANSGQVEIANHGGFSKLYNWPSSRIFRVSRASGGKDRHSKVWTSKGLRDRRVRLSVPTAIQFYDLQDRLGYDQPSKAVEWLLTAAATSIAELPSITTAFPDTPQQLNDSRRSSTENNEQRLDPAEIEMNDDEEEENMLLQQQQEPNGPKSFSKSACSSPSETSKGSGLSFSRPESRIKARERARERAAGKEKEKEIEGSGNRHQKLNPISQSSSFTELLTGGIQNNNHCPSGNGNTNESNFFQKSQREWMPSNSMDYFATGFLSPSTARATNFLGQIQLGNPHQQPVSSPLMFSVAGDQSQYSFLPDNFVPVVLRGGHGGSTSNNNNNGDYNLNFSVSSSSAPGIAGYNRGTLQSNSSSSPSMLPQMQRFSTIDGPSAFFISPTTTPMTNASSSASQHYFLSGFDPQLQLRYDNSSRHIDDNKGKGKNSAS